MEYGGWVYLLSNKKNGTLYTGVTSQIVRRVWEHKNKFADGFTKKYGVDKLVYFERHDSIEGAILREKQIKEWKRQWKIELIQSMNPDWKDLYEDICS